MACPHFEDGRFARCKAVSGQHIPTCHERERYCRSDENAACPTYRLVQLRGAPLPQDAYYALWLPPVPTAVLGADDTQPNPLAL